MSSPDLNIDTVSAEFEAACVRAIRREHGRIPRAETLERFAKVVTQSETGHRWLEWKGRRIVEETREEFCYTVRELNVPA